MNNPNTLRFRKHTRALRVLAALFFAGAAQAQGPLPAQAPAQASAPAKSIAVSGIALNATTMKPAAGLALELLNPGAQVQDAAQLATTRTGADGRFKFPARQVGADDLLLIRAPFQGYGYLAVAYDGGELFKASGLTPKPENVQVQVYNSVSKPPALTFQVHHLAIESSAKGIKCIERIVVQNPSNATYVGVGKVKGTVLLDIPAGARDVKMDPKIPGELVKTSHGWAATTPIAPSRYVNRNPLAGPSAIIFEYFVDWPSALPWARTASLSQRVLYPTNFFFVARKTDDKVLQVTAPRLGKDENQELPIGQETEVRVVNAIGRPVSDKPALKADEKLDISIKREVNPLFWAFTAFLAAIVLAVPLALRQSRRRFSPAETWDDEEDFEEPEAQEEEAEGALSHQVAAAGATSENGVARANRSAERGAGARVSTAHSHSGTFENDRLSGQARAQIEAIASLDEEFEAGRLSEPEYRRRRAQSKSRLLDQLTAQGQPAPR